jgi:hypothetical protein
LVDGNVMIGERDFVMEKESVTSKTRISQPVFLKEIERLIEILKSSHNKEAFARAAIGFGKEPTIGTASELVDLSVTDDLTSLTSSN